MRRIRIDGERKARLNGRVDPARLKWYALHRAMRFRRWLLGLSNASSQRRD